MLKLVINTKYGGFSLSYKALKRYYELKYPEKKLYLYEANANNTKLKKVKEDHADSLWGEIHDVDFGDSFDSEKVDRELYNNSYVTDCEIKRSDPFLVQTVEELGEEANGPFAKLKVITIDSDKYRICEYDGVEWVETPESIEWETA